MRSSTNTDQAGSLRNFSLRMTRFCRQIKRTRSNCQEAALKHLFFRFWADQSGATSIEYALIAGGLSIVILVAINSLGTTVSGKYQSVSAALK